MKRIFLLLLVTFLLYGLSSAQYSEPTQSRFTSKLFYWGAGVNIGGFYPGEINDFLNDYYSYAEEILGSYDMMVYYTISGHGSFFFTKMTELKVELECSGSPKLISINSSTDYYSFNRISPALKFNLHIPTGGRLSVFFGPGASFNRLKFKGPDFKSTRWCPGFSFQVGVMLRFRKFAIEPGFTFNYINSNEGDTDNPPSVGADEPEFIEYYLETIEFNYTGGQIGCTFYF
ncbi:MAG: hypothetical protein JW894_12035 [Bacteroidales bacterium]|nr:hypothetical protein [Bacteroidales bacterium]